MTFTEYIGELDAEEKSESEEAEVAPHTGCSECICDANTQADGFGESPEEDERYGEGHIDGPEWFKDTPSHGNSYRDDDLARRKERNFFGPSREEAQEAERLFVLGMAERLLAATSSANAFSPVRPSAVEAGTVDAFSQIYATLYQAIVSSVRSTPARDLAVTRLKESAMWLNRSIVGKE